MRRIEKYWGVASLPGMGRRRLRSTFYTLGLGTRKDEERRRPRKRAVLSTLAKFGKRKARQRTLKNWPYLD